MKTGRRLPEREAAVFVFKEGTGPHSAGASPSTAATPFGLIKCLGRCRHGEGYGRVPDARGSAIIHHVDQQGCRSSPHAGIGHLDRRQWPLHQTPDRYTIEAGDRDVTRDRQALTAQRTDHAKCQEIIGCDDRTRAECIQRHRQIELIITCDKGDLQGLQRHTPSLLHGRPIAEIAQVCAV